MKIRVNHLFTVNIINMGDYSAVFNFYGELADFLTTDKTPVKRVYRFNGKPSVKDAIEAQGIPHTEVEHITVNGEPVDFTYNLKNSDRVEVYPVSSIRNSDCKLLLRGDPPYRFLLDVHLGKLARLMRLSGFDCLYRNDYDDHEIADLAERLDRIVLTRDRRLLRFSSITHGYWIRSDKPREQLMEVIRRYDLYDLVNPFNRCLECNGEIEPVDKQSVIHRLEPKTKLYYNSFFICRNCTKIYWKGSHYEQMTAFLDNLKRTFDQDK